MYRKRRVEAATTAKRPSRGGALRRVWLCVPRFCLLRTPFDVLDGGPQSDPIVEHTLPGGLEDQPITGI